MSSASFVPEMVARVAAVIAADLDGREISTLQTENEDIARTVLEAIIEPTDGMAEEGSRLVYDYAGRASADGAREAWRAMVREALTSFPE